MVAMVLLLLLLLRHHYYTTGTVSQWLTKRPLPGCAAAATAAAVAAWLFQLLAHCLTALPPLLLLLCW